MRRWPMPCEAGDAAALTIAVSTIGARAARFFPPAPIAGLAWLLVVQDPPPTLPARLAGRADLRWLHCRARGVAASRNAALAVVRTPLMLFWDDDMAANLPGIAALAAEFAADPRLDLAIGQRAGLARPRRAGPGRLTRLNSASVATPEIMLRPARLAARGIRFDPRFGLGAPHGLGDEYVFVADALRAGLRGRRFAHVLGHHPPRSTGDDWSNPALLAARAAVLARVFGPLAPLARAGLAVRHLHDLGGLRAAMAFAAGAQRFTPASEPPM